MKTLIQMAKDCDGRFCEQVTETVFVLGTLAVMIYSVVGLQTVA